MSVTDPMLRGAEALATLQEIARTPHHSRQIVGERAADILNLIELYRMMLAQAQITERTLIGVRSTLALHKSIALSGEQPTAASDRMYVDAMTALKRVKSGLEVAKCADCQKYHDRSRMKVKESFQKAGNMDPKDWTLMCCNCWQAYLQTELGMLRVHAGRVVKDAAHTLQLAGGCGRCHQ